ncbi:unnamed protein product, partial [Rotaria sp. Silwood1]
MCVFSRLYGPLGITRNTNRGTLYISDSGNHHAIQYVLGATASVVVADGNRAGSANNQLSIPVGLYFDSASNSLVIVNSESNNAVRWVLGATTRTVLAGSSAGTAGATSALLNSPNDVTFDSMENLYVIDARNNRIQLFKVDQTDGITIAG